MLAGVVQYSVMQCEEGDVLGVIDIIIIITVPYLKASVLAGGRGSSHGDQQQSSSGRIDAIEPREPRNPQQRSPPA